jgi:hypothetical protein
MTGSTLDASIAIISVRQSVALGAMIFAAVSMMLSFILFRYGYKAKEELKKLSMEMRGAKLALVGSGPGGCFVAMTLGALIVAGVALPGGEHRDGNGGFQKISGAHPIEGQVARPIDAGERLAGAEALYIVDHGGVASDISEIIAGNYLSGLPTVLGDGSWTISTDTTVTPKVVYALTPSSAAVCDALTGAGTVTAGGSVVGGSGACDANKNFVHNLN